MGNGLVVHHKILKMYGGQDTEENLITLCHFCHEEWHYIEEFNMSIGKQAAAITFEEWLKDIPKLWLIILQWRQPWPEDLSAREFKEKLMDFWGTFRQLNIDRPGKAEKRQARNSQEATK